MIGILHAYVLSSVTLKENKIAVEPQKKVSTVISLHRVAIKTPEPIVEPIQEEVLPESPKPVVEEVVVPPKKIKKKIVKKKKVTKKKKIVKKKKYAKAKKVAKKRSMTPRSSANKKAIKNAYLSKVRRTIEQHKKYPKAAKRMKQQGVVYVKFTIKKNGSIKHIVLAKSSSYAKLNKAAVKILKNIRAFAAIPRELGVKYLSVTVPIRYKILN